MCGRWEVTRFADVARNGSPVATALASACYIWVCYKSSAKSAIYEVAAAIAAIYGLLLHMSNGSPVATLLQQPRWLLHGRVACKGVRVEMRSVGAMGGE